MIRKGKYIRRIYDSESDDDEPRSQIAKSRADAVDTGRTRGASNYDSDASSDSDGANPGNSSTCSEESGSNSGDDASSSPAYSSRSPSDPPSTPEATPQKDSRQIAYERANAERHDRMEKMVADINNFLNRSQTASQPEPMMNDDADKGWKFSNDVDQRGSGENSSSNIRWDHLKPFPSGIPANKMWEEWNRYVDNFEIAASLSNVMDPAKRTQLLYLSMGTELQGIINAAKLRPGLSNSSCYSTFVTNIQKYLRSMTDTAAEHEAFTRMMQGNDESAVAFHARLVGKVRSCNYSVDDEDRFVRAQLLTGLRNRELVTQSRTFGYDTNFIVQSATRNEAFQSEIRQRDESSVLEIRSGHSRSSYEQSNRKRPIAASRDSGPPARQQRTDETSRRPHGEQCTRCFLFNHRNGKCPALSRNCNKCGKRGHFAAGCRQKQINVMQSRPNFNRFPDRSDGPDDDKQDSKQVLTDY